MLFCMLPVALLSSTPGGAWTQQALVAISWMPTAASELTAWQIWKTDLVKLTAILRFSRTDSS